MTNDIEGKRKKNEKMKGTKEREYNQESRQAKRWGMETE